MLKKIFCHQSGDGVPNMGYQRNVIFIDVPIFHGFGCFTTVLKFLAVSKSCVSRGIYFPLVCIHRSVMLPMTVSLCETFPHVVYKDTSIRVCGFLNIRIFPALDLVHARFLFCRSFLKIQVNGIFPYFLKKCHVDSYNGAYANLS